MDDHIKMSVIAENLLMTNEVFIANEVLAEAVYVLRSVYKISKKDISTQLISLIQFENISTLNDNLTIDALNHFKNKNLDFVDCILCSYSIYDEVKTFDKKLNKCITEYS
jgi:predicted nucleic-acid-binding protein